MPKGYRTVIDADTGKKMYLKKRKKRKAEPDASKPASIVQALNKGVAIDRRTKAGRDIYQVKEAVRENLDAAAKAMLEDDVAHAAVIQRAAIEQAYKTKGGMFDANGKPCEALKYWSKYAAEKRAALLALRKFQPPAPKEPPADDIGSMVLEVSAEPVDPDSEGPGTQGPEEEGPPGHG